MTRAHPTKKSDAKASNSQLAQPPCVRRGRCCPGSIRTAGCPTDPRPRDCRGRAGGAPQAWSAGRRRSARHPHAEIAARDRRPRRGDVTVDQLAHPRTSRHGPAGRPRRRPGRSGGRGPGGAASHPPWRPRPRRPHRSSGTRLGRGGRCVVAVGRQHCRSGRFQQGPQRFDPGLAHSWEPSGKQPQGQDGANSCVGLVRPLLSGAARNRRCWPDQKPVRPWA
jgi:hypothetical protein